MTTKVAGVDVLLSATVLGVPTSVGGQTGASLARTAGTMDVTDKNSQGWSTAMAGLKSWEVACDGFIVLGDTALEALFTAYDTRTPVAVTIRVGAGTDATGYSYTGSAIITDFPEDYKQTDAVSFKLTMKGASPLVRVVGTVIAPTVTVKTVTLPATTGFTLALSVPILGLTPANVLIYNYLGVLVVPTAVTTANSGATYTILCTLPSAHIATVDVVMAGYNDGFMAFVNVP
jgi:predicted secreted protein